MKLKYFSILGALAMGSAVVPLAIPPVAHAVSTDVQPKDEDVQILTRGPVHEAFAAVVTGRPEPGLIVTKAPPPAIEELPPEKQLEGDNVTWISGYWAWDDDMNDFLWVSGVWRNIPPGREWVPGYWNDLGDSRWQWTAGYWGGEDRTEVEYVGEAPPESLDAGPNIDPPDDNSNWVPGNWRYAETRYVWSPGYWAAPRPDWTWVPSCWAWTPHGYCYNDGYWDYAIGSRGVLFAPAYFHRPLWSDPGYYYTPSVVVGLGVFDNHCWVRPGWGHYYYGDYYGAHYSDLGFVVSFNWHGRRGCYDPLWAYNSWYHRHDGGWGNRVRDRYAFFRDNADARPPRTWAAMRDLRNDRFSNDERARGRFFASSLNGYAANPVRGERFRDLNRASRDQLVAQRQQVRDFAQQRRQLETARVARPDGANATARTGRIAALNERLSRSPVVGRQINQIAQNQGPPRRPVAAGGAGRVRPDAVVNPSINRSPARPNNAAIAQNRNAMANRIPGVQGNRAVPQIGGNAARPGVQSQNATQPRSRQQLTPQLRQQIQPRQSVQPQQQRRPQANPQQRQQIQRQQSAPRQMMPTPQRSRPQQVAPQRQQIQRQQAARPASQRVAPQRQQIQRQQSFQRPQAQVQRSRPQVQVQRSRPAMQVQRSRPSVQQSRPQVSSQPRQVSPQRSTTQRSSSSTQRSSGKTRNR